MPIRASSSGAHRTRPQLRRAGRHRPEQVVAINRCAHATLHLNRDALMTTAHVFALWKAVEQLSREPGFGLRLIEALDTAAFPPLHLCRVLCAGLSGQFAAAGPLQTTLYPGAIGLR